jgi:hypothetical protein
MGETIMLVVFPKDNPKFPPKKRRSLRLGGSSHPDAETGRTRQQARARAVRNLCSNVDIIFDSLDKIIKFHVSPFFAILIPLLTQNR